MLYPFFTARLKKNVETDCDASCLLVFLPLDITMEPLRKQLMARQPQWGDSLSPLQLSASQSGSDRENRGNPAPQAVDANSHRNSVEDLNAYDELIMADPKTRRKRTSAVKPQTLSCKDWTLESLVRQSKNFAEVPRIQWSPDISTSIRAHEANNKGVPLVVEGLHNNPRWIKDKFTPDWLERNGPKGAYRYFNSATIQGCLLLYLPDISVRNMCDRSDKSIALPNFIARTRAISPFATPGESERLYGKDVPCPPEWNQFLHSGGVVPPFLSPDGPENLLNNLPKADQPETLMCYLGVGDTFTPCHKDLCASSGHNLMCYTENGGSSFWFMTATSSANAAAEYFTKNLKEQLDHETHVITVEQLAKAPFKVYVTEQKLGDLVLVPPRSSHQVVNAGGMTIKTSWSRITLDGLSLALRYELPLYRRVCRSEIYRIKSTIYHTLLQTIRTGSNLLGKQPKTNATPGSRNAIASTSQKDLPDTLLRLLLLFDSILIDEYSEETSSMQTLTPAVSQPSEMDAEDDAIGQLTCDFCGCDVFQSFFECRACVDGGTADPGAGFILCSGCYVEGRTCHCETMVPMQCRSFSELLETRSRALDLFTELESRPSNHVVVQIPFQERLENEMGLFRAALVLQKRRAKPQGNDQRRCTVRRSEAEQSHDSLNALLLPCKKCHSSTCLAHVAMDRRLHSAEAFLAHEKDVSHAVFHASHKASKRRFESELADLKREDLDQVFDVRVQLAYLATTFTTCRPINPNSQLWTAGYYDLHVWETDLPADQIPNEMSATETRKVVALQGVLKRPKRMVMDCVFMPPLSRPSKGKERQVAVTERSKPRDRVKVCCSLLRIIHLHLTHFVSLTMPWMIFRRQRSLNEPIHPTDHQVPALTALIR
ncbi:hypothetical protein B0H17DRAFT_237638 [Mycena rosella]|uniref:JmjC domain-containing protein n=1 Tax=Mycena rosella TaxID=1033263 RepID=A0AAD7H106_MYCRO|nr:hypothetical protein B0H17DRAFT_237638 [Mycena rosella]